MADQTSSRDAAGTAEPAVAVNGELQTLPPGTTVGTLVDGTTRGRHGVAVALNETVVPRSRWDLTAVEPGDRVEILAAAQGG